MANVFSWTRGREKCVWVCGEIDTEEMRNDERINEQIKMKCPYIKSENCELRAHD